ncbi:MAG TPA: thiamine pyrophosphate-dependent dehydrogenase E1 component subunit alpha [Polyangiaceae bacterium]|nr:thiamine pyrophosphate-dependent dehydrogenase E1 component subunit alpha [Polyangiaceae bacterium]
MVATTRQRSESTPPESGMLRVLNDDLTLDPAYDPGLSTEQVLDMYRHMVTTRLLDERLVALQRQGRVGFHVGSLGEEAAIIGSAYAMRKTDFLFPCYRELGAALMRGLELQVFVHNMFGTAKDVVRGRQMPDHYTCRRVGFGSISSPVGTQITQAVGFAWAAKIKKQDVATLVYFGDGATSSSDFHSGMNFAGVFKIPTVFLCRNNGWAISVPTARQSATRTLAEKAAAYGVAGVQVDGNDLFAVVSAVRRAVERGVRGEGPTLIEAITYRMGGHSTNDDPNRYRGSEALEPWTSRDPIGRVRAYLEKRDAWDGAAEERLIQDIDQRFREAVAVAERTPPPPLESMFDDVYERPPWHLVEQRNEVLSGPRAPAKHGNS